MYAPRAFHETSRERLYGLIQAHNFGLLITPGSGQPQVSHLPFLLRRDPDRLLAHFARANPQWRGISAGSQVLCVFQGPHAYISPGWYERQDTVPTWNYAAVHVRGRPRLIDEEAELRELVIFLMESHEAEVESGWDQRQAALDNNIAHIVGIEIGIDEIEGTFKFNQNLSVADRRGVIEALSKSGDSTEREVAAWMQVDISEL